MKYDIFISYRRSGGDMAARKLYDTFVEKGYSVFMDVESIGPGEFDEILYTRIEECTDFVLVLTKDALKNCSDSNEEDWLQREIEYALEKKKSIVPVLFDGVKIPDEKTLPEKMRKLPRHTGIPVNGETINERFSKIESFLKSKTRREKIIHFMKPIMAAIVIILAIVSISAAFVCNQPISIISKINGEKMFFSTEDNCTGLYQAVNPGDIITICADRMFSDIEYVEYRMVEMISIGDNESVEGEHIIEPVTISGDECTIIVPERVSGEPHYALFVTAYDTNPTGKDVPEIEKTLHYHLCYELHCLEPLH